MSNPVRSHGKCENKRKQSNDVSTDDFLQHMDETVAIPLSKHINFSKMFYANNFFLKFKL